MNLKKGRIKDLGDKITTMTVSATGEVPANVLTTDASGNAELAGIFKAKEVQAEKGTFSNGVVAGVADVQNLKLGSKTSGSAKIPAGDTGIAIETSEAKAGSKIFVTPLGKLSGRTLFVDMAKVKDGENFTVELDGGSLGAEADFNWMIVN